jgi:hypothetical protein
MIQEKGAPFAAFAAVGNQQRLFIPDGIENRHTYVKKKKPPQTERRPKAALCAVSKATFSTPGRSGGSRGSSAA